jgi:hypothetical protein
MRDMEACEAKEYDTRCEREAQGLYMKRQSSVNTEKALVGQGLVSVYTCYQLYSVSTRGMPKSCR